MIRGSIVLVEGLDRTGKSTQVDLIIKDFKAANKKVELVKFPDRTTQIGKLINEYLTNKDFQLPKESIHLLFSANRWEIKDKMIRKLEEGVTLIMDRYYYSGIAYSSARGLDFNWCKSPDIGLPRPDLTLFLTFEKEKSVANLQNRENYGEERYENVEFQKLVKSQFEKLFNLQKMEKLKENDSSTEIRIIYVDNKNIEEVHQLVFNQVKKFIEKDNENVIEVFR